MENERLKETNKVKKGVNEERYEKKEHVGYIRTKAATQLLKKAAVFRSTVYVYGISGTGKTTLLKNYLKNKKFLYLSAEELTAEDLEIAEGGRQKIVVIDDLHALVKDRQSDGYRQKILELVDRDDIWLFLSGRSPVPAWLVPSRLQNNFIVIDERQLAFGINEMRRYFEQAGIPIDEKQLQWMQERTGGLPLAVAFMTEICYENGVDQMESLDWKVFEECSRQTVFRVWDYLEYHVYDQWDIEMQEFLMDVSIVEEFDCQLASMITGRNDVEFLISQAGELGNFLIEKYVTENGKNSVYAFRDDMKKSMRRRLLRKKNADQRKVLYCNAGLCYELKGELTKALAMYEEVHDKERIASILIANARKTVNSAYYYELKKHYLALPEETIRQNPELMCGMCMLQSLLLNREESERWYAELEQFAEERQGSMRRLAKGKQLFLDIALPHRGSVDMIKVLKNAYILLLDRKTVLPEFSVTSNLPSQMNGGKDFCEWSKKDRELARTIGKIIEFVLGRYGKGLVNLALAESYFEKGEDSYEVVTLANKGRMQAEMAGIYEQCFVGDAIRGWLHILNGKREDALDLMRSFYRMAEGENIEKLLPNIEAMLVRYDLYDGDIAWVKKWMEQAPDEEVEFIVFDRFIYLTKIRAYLQSGKNEQAYNLLQKLQYYAEMMQRTYIQIEAGILFAIVQYRMENDSWDDTLSEALERAQEYHFVRVISREGAAIWRLLRETSWKPSAQGKAFWEQVLEETEKMVHFYPGYLKAGVQNVVLGENATKILKLQAEGVPRSQIALELGLTEANVKYHIRQTYKKLDVRDKAAAVSEARKRKLI